jgi:hypothetical protein
MAGLVVLCACTFFPSDVTYRGDVSFTLAERRAIEYGNTFLAENTGLAPFEIVWDLPHDSDEDGCETERGIYRRSELKGGLYHRWNACIKIGVGNRDWMVLAAIAGHELGHARYLRHLRDDVPGLMNHHNAKVEWTAGDQQSCEALLVCGR